MCVRALVRACVCVCVCVCVRVCMCVCVILVFTVSSFSVKGSWIFPEVWLEFAPTFARAPRWHLRSTSVFQVEQAWLIAVPIVWMALLLSMSWSKTVPEFHPLIARYLLAICFLLCVPAWTEVVNRVWNGRDFSGYSRISGFKYLSESNKTNGLDMQF